MVTFDSTVGTVEEGRVNRSQYLDRSVLEEKLLLSGWKNCGGEIQEDKSCFGCRFIYVDFSLNSCFDDFTIVRKEAVGEFVDFTVMDVAIKTEFDDNPI